MKHRFSLHDVAAEVGCLKQKFLGMRLANIYDINAKTYLLKLARSGEEGEKVFLVLESGTRFHTTKWAKDKSDTPSNFTLKLRKHLRTRRLEDIRQLGVDRIVDFTFGTGEHCHHLILELYAQGNVILTDNKYEILTLLRSHRDDAKGVAFMARHPYPLQYVRLRQPVTAESLQAAIKDADAKATLRSVAASVLVYGMTLVDHALLTAGLNPHRPLTGLTEEGQAELLAAIQGGEAMLERFYSQPPKGYIWQVPAGSNKSKKGEAKPQPGAADPSQPLFYDEYDALPLRQNQGKSVLEFETLDEALDEFFAKIEGQKAAQVQAQQESSVLSKVDKIRIDQTRRAEALQNEAKLEETKASLIEYNLEAVDAAINAVRGALAGGLNWKELKRLIKGEREAGNPVAQTIHSLELEQNRVSLLLSNFLDEEEGDDDALMRPATKVEIDLDLNAHANARAHYESRKAKAAKQQKTVEQNARALLAAEKTAQLKLTQVKAAKVIQQLRKPYWFEKFNWFITSENYLVVSGRDMQQNEFLVKRHLRKGDVYVHADLHGASTTILKNHAPDSPVPQLSIVQAGCACVCRSQAWDAKIVTSAWWVHHDQVSKTAPTGEYLPTGSFIIRGKKNFLPPQPLIMGLAFLFRLDESSLAGHVGERAVRGTEDDASFAGEPTRTELAEPTPQEDGGPEPLAVDTSEPPTASGNDALDAFMDRAVDPLSTNHRRYGLATPADRIDAEERAAQEGGTLEGSPSGAARKHMSAYERRVQKKGGATVDGNGGGQDPAVAEARKAEAARREAKAQEALQASSEAAATTMRGKRGKAKKAQAKYAHQDEHDRQLALQLLDPAGKKKEKADKKEARKARKQGGSDAATAGLRREPPTQEELALVGAHVDARRHVAPKAADDESSPQSVAATPQAAPLATSTASEAQAAQWSKEGTSETTPAANGGAGSKADASANAAEARVPGEGPGGPPAPVGQEAEARGGVADGAEGEEEVDSSGGDGDEVVESDGGEQGEEAAEDAAEVAALLEEENIELLPDAELARLREIDALTGLPRLGDVLLHALPVCAPYSVLQGYKYRLKITPGSQRKGKAAKQAVELLTRGADMVPRERELIRSIPEQETITAIIGSVKISMPGLQKLKDQAKSQKRKGKK